MMTTTSEQFNLLYDKMEDVENQFIDNNIILREVLTEFQRLNSIQELRAKNQDKLISDLQADLRKVTQNLTDLREFCIATHGRAGLSPNNTERRKADHVSFAQQLESAVGSKVILAFWTVLTAMLGAFGVWVFEIMRK